MPYAAEVWHAAPAGVRHGLRVRVRRRRADRGPVDAIAPAFLFLAAFAALGGIIYRLVGFETRGRSLEELETGLGGGPPRAAGTTPAFVRSSPIKERVQ